MRRFKIAALAASAVLGLAGCTQSEVDLAHSGCIESARSQLPDGIEKLDTSGVETSNFSELAGELAGNPLGSNPEGSVLYTTAGDIWYRIGSQDTKVGVLCLTTFKGGQLEGPIEATLIPSG